MTQNFERSVGSSFELSAFPLGKQSPGVSAIGMSFLSIVARVLQSTICPTKGYERTAEAVFLAFAGPPLKLSERVTRSTPLATGPIEQLLSSLNLGVQKSLDPDANNLVAAGTFVYGSIQSPVKVG